MVAACKFYLLERINSSMKSEQQNILFKSGSNDHSKKLVNLVKYIFFPKACPLSKIYLLMDALRTTFDW